MEIFLILSFIGLGGIAYSSYLKRKVAEKEVARLQEKIKIVESTKTAAPVKARKSKRNATTTETTAAAL